MPPRRLPLHSSIIRAVSRIDSSFAARYGPWAVVAGASMGLGAEYARQVAARGLNVVLVAWPHDGLEEVAREIEERHRVETRCCAIDLGDPEAASRLLAATAGLEIGLVVYNAAVSGIGPFLQGDLEEKLRTIDVNCRGPLLLAHVFGGAMARRQRGGLVLMSSLSAFHGTAMVSTYAATKAFNLILGESMWEELRSDGVDVLVVCPGATRTPGFEQSNARVEGRLFPPLMTPDQVVGEALEALGRQPVVVTGRANRLMGFLLNRILSRRGAVTLLGRSMRRMYDR
jgi:short-subunit dehydrogenase